METFRQAGGGMVRREILRRVPRALRRRAGGTYRNPSPACSGRLRIGEALRGLGVRTPERRSVNGKVRRLGRFWDRPRLELWKWLEAARRAYRQSSKERHPDRGGSARQMAELNRAWARVKYLFGRRGMEL